MVKTVELPVLEKREYSETTHSERGKEHTTGEVVFGLLAGATLFGGIVGNHYLIDYSNYNFVNKASLLAIGGEAATYLAFCAGYVMSKKTPKSHSEGLESKISLN